MNNKKTKFKLGKKALILAIMTLLTVLTWIFFEVYKTLHKTTIPQVTKEQMQPLDPEINTALIESLKNTLNFSEDELNILPTPTPTEAVPIETETGEESQ